jgi:hypothetical protein
LDGLKRNKELAEENVTEALGLDPIVQEAIKRFNQCSEWESTARKRFVEDYKFANGDSDNGYQWPNGIRNARDVDARPCLTMNVVRQHNYQITNEAKKNKASVTVLATGNGATADAAAIYKALIRHIEYISNAQSAYSTAQEFQVAGGVGYWRIVTAYEEPDTFDQEIYIQRVTDPLSVFLDPDAQEKDGSDSRFGFVFDDMPKEEFNETYPRFKGLVGQQPLGVTVTDADWLSKDHVRVCEYFRKVKKTDTLYSFVDPQTGERLNIRASRMPEDVLEAVENHPLTRSREVEEEVIEWRLIAGEKVINESIWPGKYIPIVKVIGEETVIEHTLDRKGHTRALKDAQRMYNYNCSSQVEFVALQGKTPWIAPVKAIEEYESMWNTANVANHSVLPYNHMDDEGNPIPEPTRLDPPSASNAYAAGMDTAFNQMMMTSGQWQNQMGMMGNERTGAAISRRQDQSATATFHFQDNYDEGLRYTGKQLLDLIPKIYDTKRTRKLLAEDGTEMEVLIDPTAKQALEVRMNQQQQIIKRIFNPTIGKYDVAADVGPNFATSREESLQALTLILTQAPELTALIGDLLLRDMNFDSAQEAAQRLKRMVPPQALGVGPTQQEQVLQTQVTSLTNALQQSLQQQAKDSLKLVGKAQLRDIDVYEAETKRMSALKEMLVADPQGLLELIKQLLSNATDSESDLGPVIKANEDDLDLGE